MIKESDLLISLPFGRTKTIRDHNNLVLQIRGLKKGTSHVFYLLVDGSYSKVPVDTLVDARAYALQKANTAPAITLHEVLAQYYAYFLGLHLANTTVKKFKLYFNKYLAKEAVLPVTEVTPRYVFDTYLKEPYQAGKYDTVGYLKRKILASLDLAKVEYPHLQIPDISTITLLYKLNKHARHQPSLSYEYIAELANIGPCTGVTRCLYELSYHLLLRPLEIASIKLSDIDTDDKVLNVPKTKTMVNFKVPLTDVALLLIQVAKLLKADSTNPYLFEGKADGHINSSVINVLLKRCGYSGLQTAHGIRSMGRTWMAHKNINYEVAEMCLSHITGNSTVRAYLRTDYLEERRVAMKAWSEYVLKAFDKYSMTNLLID